MALTQAQLLKRKAKKTKARAEKAKTIQQESHLRYLSKWPIVAAYAPLHPNDDLTLQYVLIVRQRPDGQYTVGSLLIDTLCLGVKDCFIKIIPSYQFVNMLEKIEEAMPMDVVPPSYVATFVHKAVEYAKNLGLNPRGDYQVLREFLDGVPLDESLTFTFGKDGKPIYIQGPQDSPEFSRKVIDKLNQTIGSENYEFVVSLEGPEE